MKIKWLGHSCFLVTLDRGLKIITDPYKVEVAGPISYGPVKESSDIVTISHQHSDHNYTKDIQGSPEIIQGIGKHSVKGIEFVGIPCYHDRVSGQERGDNTIFYFTVDNVKMCHCGDLGHPLDDSVISSLGHVDVLLIPTGGPPATLELYEAVALWEKLQPGIIIPMHFRNEKCKFFKYGVEDLMRLKVTALLPGRSEIEFTAGRYPVGQILVLDPAL